MGHRDKLKDVDPELLRDLYINQKLSTSEIGKIFSVTSPAVYNKLRKLNIINEVRTFRNINSIEEANNAIFNVSSHLKKSRNQYACRVTLPLFYKDKIVKVTIIGEQKKKENSN